MCSSMKTVADHRVFEPCMAIDPPLCCASAHPIANPSEPLVGIVVNRSMLSEVRNPSPFRRITVMNRAQSWRVR